MKKYGYHIKEIEKGEIGTSSKILEEMQEFLDAEEQGVKLMVLMELSDLILAISLYIQRNYKDFSLEDLMAMSGVTKRAFENGLRN